VLSGCGAAVEVGSLGGGGGEDAGLGCVIKRYLELSLESHMHPKNTKFVVQAIEPSSSSPPPPVPPPSPLRLRGAGYAARGWVQKENYLKNKNKSKIMQAMLHEAGCPEEQRSRATQLAAVKANGVNGMSKILEVFGISLSLSLSVGGGGIGHAYYCFTTAMLSF
jgi:hypothetical protein